MSKDQVVKGVTSTLEFLEAAAEGLVRLLPSLREVKVLRPWAGLVETTRDFRPVCGRLKYDNLWVAFADSGKGIMFAPAIGELLAESIQIDQLSQDLSPYSPERLFS
jgi:sarcosine oxidase subunit beta